MLAFMTNWGADGGTVDAAERVGYLWYSTRFAGNLSFACLYTHSLLIHVLLWSICTKTDITENQAYFESKKLIITYRRCSWSNRQQCFRFRFMLKRLYLDAWITLDCCTTLCRLFVFCHHTLSRLLNLKLKKNWEKAKNDYVLCNQFRQPQSTSTAVTNRKRQAASAMLD